jgi:hypothetical protein
MYITQHIEHDKHKKDKHKNASFFKMHYFLKCIIFFKKAYQDKV